MSGGTYTYIIIVLEHFVLIFSQYYNVEVRGNWRTSVVDKRRCELDKANHSRRHAGDLSAAVNHAKLSSIVCSRHADHVQ